LKKANKMPGDVGIEANQSGPFDGSHQETAKGGDGLGQEETPSEVPRVLRFHEYDKSERRKEEREKHSSDRRTYTITEPQVITSWTYR